MEFGAVEAIAMVSDNSIPDKDSIECLSNINEYNF